jgi:hypothetical protein
MSALAALQDLNWKRHGNMAIKILMNMKVLGLIALLAFTVFGIGWDTVLRPNLTVLQSREESINKVKSELSTKQEFRKRYLNLEQQLSNLTISLLPIPAGNSSTVIAVTESSEILKLAQGKTGNDASIKALPKPHNLRENVSLKPLNSSVVDLSQLINDPNKPASTTTTPPPTAGSQPTSTPGTGADASNSATSLERFDYELKVTGTYPALMDLLNALAIRKKMVKINQVDIIPSSTPQTVPDAKDYPDFPLKLDMTISLSLFLYNAAATAS